MAKIKNIPSWLPIDKYKQALQKSEVYNCKVWVSHSPERSIRIAKSEPVSYITDKTGNRIIILEPKI